MIWQFLLVLFSLLLIGMPVAFAMMIAASVMLFLVGIFNTSTLAEYLITGANSFSLMAIPFFILTGEIMNAGGVSKRIVDFASSLVGHFRGGLGYVAIIAGVVFAGLSGSAVADTAALGAILIPMMVAQGYNKNSTTGLVASVGIIGTVIPPSIPMILYGVVGGVSITQLFMAGIVPGLIMALGMMLVWYLLSRTTTAGRVEKATGRERLHYFLRAFWALLLPGIIIIGLRGGVFTPTEAGVIAAVYALLISFVYREIKVSQLYDVLVGTAKTTAIVMLIASAAIVTAYAITVARVPAELATVLGGMTENPTVMLLIIMAFLLLVGCVMDMTPAVLIFAPVLIPVVESLGIDPVYFGVLMVINLSIGLITPPVGTVLYVGCSISKISLLDITKGIWPMLAMYFAVLISFILFPQIVTVPMEWLSK
ncbi:TRAP transporter large permease [Vreelandella titanicae]|uniref:TRAP transporter large permease n=1 Tax=Vreelandella titanicae TaxID=664683 RepID=UPI001681627A|nr:TRAP transporter large permease [Halomonas titanicae]QNU64002.1 TRAP transporter large permease [Halomonas titanicae]